MGTLWLQAQLPEAHRALEAAKHDAASEASRARDAAARDVRHVLIRVRLAAEWTHQGPNDRPCSAVMLSNIVFQM
jgi:hypothetical protein